MNQNQCYKQLEQTISTISPQIWGELNLTKQKLEQLSEYIIKASIADESINGTIIPQLNHEIYKIYNSHRRNILIQNFFGFTSSVVEQKINKYNLHAPLASKTIKDDSVLQRRMDSLARILSVHSQISSCIAVTFVENNLCVASNTPTCNKQLQNKVEKKLAILRNFLKDFHSETSLVLQDQDAIKLTLSTKLAAFVAGRELASYGTGVFKTKKYFPRERLAVDLMKIATYFLEGIGTQSRKGFTAKQREALMSKPNFFLPDDEMEKKMNLAWHAEQLMVEKIGPYCQNLSIGISKLACEACEDALTAYGARFRGSSGKSFKRVYSIKTNSEYRFFPKRIAGPTGLIPSDSDSAVEISSNPRSSIVKSNQPYSIFRHSRNQELENNTQLAIKVNKVKS